VVARFVDPLVLIQPIDQNVDLRLPEQFGHSGDEACHRVVSRCVVGNDEFDARVGGAGARDGLNGGSELRALVTRWDDDADVRESHRPGFSPYLFLAAIEAIAVMLVMPVCAVVDTCATIATIAVIEGQQQPDPIAPSIPAPPPPAGVPPP